MFSMSEPSLIPIFLSDCYFPNLKHFGEVEEGERSPAGNMCTRSGEENGGVDAESHEVF